MALVADDVPGFTVPVHRARSEPILLGGAPRAIAIWAIGHFAAVWAAKRDPLFVDVGRRHLRIPAHLTV